MVTSTSFSIAALGCFFLFLLRAPIVVATDPEYEVELGHMSDFSRSMSAQSAVMSSPESPKVPRQVFPQTDPHVCLAFLSCCDRQDLLRHTLGSAIRHMEQDEPENLRYEIAWVDNGSKEHLTQDILDNYQIEHALTMEQNTGLAYGMNLLIQNLCTAPYILLLEEDWLYLDDLVTDQTDRRKAAIATAIAFAETNQTAYDGRQVMGVFLRPEVYKSFMKFPFMDVWQETSVDLHKLPSAKNDDDDDDDCIAESRVEDINYQIYCSDPSTTSEYIWGSYTNGAGLYKRSALMDVGRMYGEPGDAFHDRYVEGNYAYRAGLKYCHAAIQLEDCQDIADRKCTAAFYHIGGGRGTRPMRPANSKCASQLWNFVGTPIFHRYLKILGDDADMCSKEEIRELKTLTAKENDAADYLNEVKERNTVVFEKEQAERDLQIAQAGQLREADKNWVRENIKMMAQYTDEQIIEAANKMERLAKSPHPLQGYWDSHGRPLV